MLTRSTNASPCIPGFHYASATARSPRHSPSRISAIGASAVAASAAGSIARPSSLSPVLPEGAALAAAPSVSSPLARPVDTTTITTTTAPATTTTPPSSSSSSHRYVAVDAATQYSPMELFDYAAYPHRYPPPPSTPLDPPPTPGPGPMEPGIEQGVGCGAAQTDGPPGCPPAAVSVGCVPAHPSHTQPFGQPLPSQPPSQHPPHTRSHNTQTPSPNKRRSEQSPPPEEAVSAASADGGGANAGGAASPSSLVRSPASGAKRVKADVEPPKMLPERYEHCATEDMVVLIANMLGELIETNDALALKAGHLTRFHSRTAPGISVLDYLNRLAKHATLTPPLLLSMVYYIDRLCAMYPDFTINTLTVHRFLITAATVAAKGLSDSFWNNTTYARVGGVRVAELKMLELEFLYRLEWKIVPNPEVLAAYYRPLVERCSGYALPADSSDEGGGHAHVNSEAEAKADAGVVAESSHHGHGGSHYSHGDSATQMPSRTAQGASNSLSDKDLVVAGSGPGRSSNP